MAGAVSRLGKAAFDAMTHALPEVVAKKTSQATAPQANGPLGALRNAPKNASAAAPAQARRSMLPTPGGKPLSRGLGDMMNGAAATAMSIQQSASHLTSPDTPLGQLTQALQQKMSTSSMSNAMGTAADQNAALTQAAQNASQTMQFASMMATIMNKGVEAAVKAAGGQ
jgi:hypothetical protein